MAFGVTSPDERAHDCALKVLAFQSGCISRATSSMLNCFGVGGVKCMERRDSRGDQRIDYPNYEDGWSTQTTCGARGTAMSFPRDRFENTA